MTTISSSLLLVGSVLLLLAIGFGLFAAWPKNGSGGRPADRWIVVQGALIFAAVWPWFAVLFPILAWMLWFGDNDYWFYQTSTYIAAGAALAYAWFVMARISRGRASRVYVQFHWWCPMLLLAVIAALWAYEWGRDIDGTTPEVAATAILQKEHFGEEVRLVEDPQPNDSLPTCKTYWIMGAEEPRGRITVCPKGRFGWQLGGNEWFPPSAQELERAKELLQKPGDRDRARLILEAIVKNYPGTKAEREARRLLKERIQKQLQ
jgi:hypothetical protein